MTILKLLVSPLADSSITNEGLHAFSLAKEKFSSMAETILYGNWVQFNTLLHEIKELKLSQKCLNKLCQNQVMEIAVVRDFTSPELNVLREKLILMGISEEVVDEGFQQVLSKIGRLTPSTVAPAGSRRMLIAGVYKKRKGEPRLKLA